MATKKPGGIICPIATPLDEQENLDVESFHKLLDLVLPDVDGIFFLGSTGEFALLRDEVADQVVTDGLDYVGGRMPVYMGISDTGTSRALARLKRAAREGIDYVVATSPYYYPISNQAALMRHFRTIADASELPLILYNIPQNTAVNLTPASLAELTHHPNIAGIKDSWGDLFQFQEFLSVREKDFVVMQGREQLTAISLWLGADGVVSALANFAPQMLQEIRSAVQHGDREAAIRLQQNVSELARVFDQTHFVSGLKAVLFEMGIGNGIPAQPIPLCTPQQVALIRQLLQNSGLLLMEKKHGE
jgi:dihydrodipicolinate synthase/N-acetylneuraminate lyase